MTTLKNFLIKNKAYGSDLFNYAKDMTLKQFFNNCNRTNWIFWLFAITNPSGIKQQVLAAAHCANACRHLLKDEKSLKAIVAAMNFESYSKEELREISYAARAAADAAYAAAYAAYAAAYAAYAAANAAYAAARAANAADYSAAYAVAIAADYAANALKDPKLIADIVRKYLPLELWNQEIINN